MNVQTRALAHPTWANPVGWIAFGVGGLVVLGGFAGFYDVVQWAPLGLLVTCAACAAVLRRGTWDRRAGAAATVGVGLWCWSWLSVAWAQDESAALIVAVQVGVYTAAFVAGLGWGARSSFRWALVVGLAGGCATIAVWDVAVLLVGDARGLFAYARLQEPLGYANGLAAVLALGLWPALALCERESRRPLLAGMALSLCVALVGLIILTGSRSGGLALVIGALVVLTVPGRWRRLGALSIVAVATAAMTPILLDVFRSRFDAPDDALHAMRTAGLALMAGSIAAGTAWAAVVAWCERAARDPARWRVVRQRGHRFAAAGLALVLIAVVVSSGNPVTRARTQVEAFTHLKPDRERDARFFTAAGNRYDYWRVAVLEWKAHPLGGVGGGNYALEYFARRRTTEAVRQPHNLGLQVLAELGAVGAALLLAGFVLIARGWWRWRRIAASSQAAQTVAVGLGGAVASWITHASLDWIHLLAATTVVAMGAAAALIRSPEDHAATAIWTGVRARLALGLALAALAVFGLVRVLAADRLEAAGRRALSSDPSRAVQRAESALRFDAERLSALYLVAAARSRMNDYAGARRALLSAADAVPQAATPHVLLGDLSRRRHGFAEARRQYRLALARDPRNVELQRLTSTPDDALAVDPTS